jgi:DNA-directed RNA polymerase specialized sigma subunit
MPTIFETITQNLPKATEEQKQQLESLQPVVDQDAPGKALPLKDVVVRWQKNPTPDDTAYLLKKMKPTINSAMTSYAPGHANDMAIKAARLTLDALKTFDPSKGVDPTTYVFHNLKRLSRFAARRQNIIPVSEQAMHEYNYLEKVQQEFIDKYDREPSDLELADRTGYSLKKIEKIRNGNSIVSETSTINPETNSATQFSSDLTDQDFFEYVYRSVSPIDQKIMEWSAGYHGRPMLNNKQIAEKLHLSAAAISQRKAKIIQKLEEVRGLL